MSLMFTVFKTDWSLDRKYSTLSHFAWLHFLTLAHLVFLTGMRLVFYSSFPHKWGINSGMSTDFSLFLHTFQNCLAISRFFNSLWDLEAKLWDCELASQTESLMVKPWELEGMPHVCFLFTFKHPFLSRWIQSMHYNVLHGSWT